MANEVKIVLKAVDGGFEGAIDRAVASTDKLAGSVQRVAHYGTALIGLNFAAGWARQAGQVMDAFSTLDSRLKLATGSAREAANEYVALFDIAQRARVSFTELGSTYAQISRATKDLGVSQGELRRVTETIAKAMTIGGGSAESMKAALIQLSQGLASGTLRGEELNSVIEQTPRLAQAIANGMGVSIGQLRQMGAEGKITAEAVMEALKSQAGAIDKEFSQVKATIGQAFQVLGDSMGNAIHQLDKAGDVSGRVSGAILSIADSIKTATDSAEKADSLYKLLEIMLALGTARMGLAAAARLIPGLLAGAGAAGSGVVGATGTVVLGSLLWAGQKDMSGYAGSMTSNRPEAIANRIRAAGPEYDYPGNPVTSEDILGKSSYLRPKELMSAQQAHFAKREEMIDAFKKAVKEQRIQESDPAYAMLANDLAGALREADEKYLKKGEKKDKPDPLARLRLDERAAEAGLAPDTVGEIDKLNTALASRNITIDEYNRLLGVAIDNDRVLSQEEREKQRGIEQARQAQDAMTQSVHSLTLAYQQRNQKAGEALLSADERELAEALRQVSERAQQARDSLAQKAASMKGNVEAQAAYQAKLGEVNAAEAAQAELERQHHAERMARNADWRTGVTQAMNDYGTRAKNVAESSRDAMTRAFQGMEDAMVQFTMSGKLNFSSLANSVIADIVRMQIRAAMTGQAGPLAGMFSWATGSGNYAAPGTSDAGPTMGSLFNAKGNVFSDAPSLHQYANTVQSSPKVFSFGKLHAFAKGGVFAEAGPEAVMPLTRDSSGRLGVRAQGGMAPVININVKNEAGADGYQASATARDNGRGGIDIDMLVSKAVAGDLGRNGNMSKAFAATFGLRRAS